MNHPFSLMSRFLSQSPILHHRKDSHQIAEFEYEYLLSTFIPGRSIDQIKIEMKAGLLHISVLDTEASPAEDATLIWQEFSLKVPNYTFRIPRDVELDSIKATVTNGNLIILLPKKEIISKSIPVTAKTA